MDKLCCLCSMVFLFQAGVCCGPSPSLSGLCFLAICLPNSAMWWDGSSGICFPFKCLKWLFFLLNTEKRSNCVKIPPIFVILDFNSPQIWLILLSGLPLEWYHISTIDLGVLDPMVVIHFGCLFCTGVNRPMRVVFSLLVMDTWQPLYASGGA